MASRRIGLIAASVCAVAGAAVFTGQAFAHGVHAESAADKSVPEFVWLGVEHMALGFDHLLFILGVVLMAANVRQAAKFISVFVAGHSLTLLIATLAGWQINAILVDVVIALSVVYVAIQGLRGPPRDGRITGAIIFGFGLVHGLGLSTRLQDLGLPDDGLVWRILAFNVGVELGQLAVLAVVVAVGVLVSHWLPDVDRLRRAAFAAIGVTGVFLSVLLVISGTAEQQAAPVTSASARGPQACAEQTTDRLAQGSHGSGPPDRVFYRSGESIDEGDLAHVLGDGLLVVRYSPNLPAGEREALERWVSSDESAVGGVIGAPARGQREPIRAVTARTELICRRFSLSELGAFRFRWFQQIGAI